VAVKFYILVSRNVVVIPYVITDVSEDNGVFIMRIELKKCLPTYVPP